MHASRSAVLSLVLLAAACGGAPSRGSSPAASSSGGSPADVGGALDPTPQSERAASFPATKTSYYCQWVEASGYTAEKIPTPFAVTPAAVKVYASGDSKYVGDFTEYPIDSQDGAYVRTRDDADEEERSVVLGDGMIYLLVAAAGSTEPEVQLACALEAEQHRITGIGHDAHRARLQAYAEGRRQAFLATAADVDVGDLDLGDLDLGDVDVDGDDDAPRWTAAQAAQIARARTMESFTFEASAASNRADIKLLVVVTLADGSTMRIGGGDPIFPALFGFSRAGNTTSTMVDVWPLDEDGAEVRRLRQYKEIAYTAPVSEDHVEGGSQNLYCEGKPGDAGIERNWNDNGRLYYRGQPGQTGPSITVEITTVSAANPRELRFRLRCGDQQKVFNGSASTAVTVTTVGGNGGYGIEQANGDGSSGGDGGDGGDITVLIDPSVGDYTLRTVSRGGKGGNPSTSHGFGKGNRGRDGSEGSVDERRQPVTIK